MKLKNPADIPIGGKPILVVTRATAYSTTQGVPTDTDGVIGWAYLDDIRALEVSPPLTSRCKRCGNDAPQRELGPSSRCLDTERCAARRAAAIEFAVYRWYETVRIGNGSADAKHHADLREAIERITL